MYPVHRAMYTRFSLSNYPSRTAAASSGNVRGLQRINQHPGPAIARSLRCVAQVEAEGRHYRLQWAAGAPTGSWRHQRPT